MKNIILADDHSVVRNGIKLLVESQKQFKVVAGVNNGKEVIELLEKNIHADLVIAEITMKGMTGLELTTYLTKHYPEIKIIILSTIDDEQLIYDCFERGAKGYILKNISPEEMLFAIQHVTNGGKYLCEIISMNLLNKLKDCSRESKEAIIKKMNLSERDIEVLTLIGEGSTNTEIADKLFLSKRTIEGYRQNLIEKAKVKNSAELIKFAVKNRLI